MKAIKTYKGSGFESLDHIEHYLISNQELDIGTYAYFKGGVEIITGNAKPPDFDGKDVDAHTVAWRVHDTDTVDEDYVLHAHRLLLGMYNANEIPDPSYLSKPRNRWKKPQWVYE